MREQIIFDGQRLVLGLGWVRCDGAITHPGSALHQTARVNMAAREFASKLTDLDEFTQTVCRIVEKWAMPDGTVVGV
jgi:hypothetical protein